MTTLQNENRRLKEETATWRTQLSAAAQAVAELEERLRSDKGRWEKDRLVTLSQSARREEELRRANAGLQNALVEAKEAQRALELVAFRLRGEVKSAEAQLALAQQRIEELTKEIQALRATREQRTSRQEAQIRELESKLKVLSSEKQLLIKDCKTVNSCFQS